MKTFNLVKSMMALVAVFALSLTISAATGDNNLIYNTEEVDGLKVAETVYKNEDGMLINYLKYSYKYDENRQMTESVTQKWNSSKMEWVNDICIRYTYDSKSVTTEYYKWNAKKNDFILVPEMTVTMDK